MARPKKTRATDSKTIVSTPDSSGGIDGGKVDKRARFKALLAARDYAAAVTLGRSVIDFDAEKSALQDPAFLKDWRRALIGAMECQRAARWSEELRQNIEFAESVGALQPASALIRRLTDRWRWADFGAEEPDIITEDPPLNAVLLAVRKMLRGDPAELDPTAYRKVVKRLLVVCDDLNQAHGRENPIGGQCEAIADLLRLACACRVGALSQASPRLIKFAKEHPRIGLLVDFSANRMVQLARYRLESWPDSRGRILVAIAMSKRGYSDYIAFDGDFDQAVLRVLPQNWIQGIPQIGVEAAAESAPPSKQGQLFSGEPFSQAESSQSRRGKKEVKRPGRKGAALEMHCDAILQTRSVTENSLTSLLKHLQRSKDVEVLAPDRMVSLLEKLLSQIEEQTGNSQFDLAVLSVDCTLRLIELIERSQLCQRALPRTVSLERVKAYLRETRLTLSSLSSHFIRQIFAYDQVLQELMAKDSPNDQVERRALAQRILEICQEVREGQPFYFKDIKIALQRALLQLAIQPVPDINFAERLVAVGPLPEDMRARLLKAFGEKHKERAALDLFEAPALEFSLRDIISRMRNYLAYPEAAGVLIKTLKRKLLGHSLSRIRRSHAEIGLDDEALKNFYTDFFHANLSEKIGVESLYELHLMSTAVGLNQSASELKRLAATRAEPALSAPLEEPVSFLNLKARFYLAWLYDESDLLRVQLREVRKRISKLSDKDPAEAARAIFLTLGILEDFIRKPGLIADDAKVWQEGLTAAFQALDSTQRWRPLYEAADEGTDALLASWQGNQELSYNEDEAVLPLMKLTRLLLLWCKSYPNLALLPLAQGLGEALEFELDPQALDPWIKKARRALKKNKDPEVAELLGRIEQSQRASFSLSDILNFFSNSFEY